MVAMVTITVKCCNMSYFHGVSITFHTYALYYLIIHISKLEVMTNLLHSKSECKARYLFWVNFPGLNFCCVTMTFIFGQNNHLNLRCIILNRLTLCMTKLLQISFKLQH